MSNKEWIENIVIRELQELCSTCRHVHTCAYFQQSKKKIIQCEHYTRDQEGDMTSAPKGLCKSCDRARHCALPERITGVWHCNEYQ